MHSREMLARVILFLAKILPPPAFRGLGKIVSIFFYCCGIKSKSVVKTNMRKIHLKFSIRIYMNFAQFLCENIYLYWNDIDVRRFRIFNRHILDRALAEGKGVLVLSTHHGNWELAGQYLRFIGYPVNVIYEKKGDWIYDYLDSIRQKYGIKLIDRNSPLSEYVKILKENGILGILIDHKSNNIQLKSVEFLSIKREMPYGWFRLASASGAPVVLLHTSYKGGVHNIFLYDGRGMGYEEYYSFFQEKIKHEIFQYDFFNRIWQDTD